jgi:Flp pilus assembly protein TadG
MHPQLHRQRGAVAIMVALAMLVLLAVVGLAIDAGLAYLVKARLNAAVDSAALAAARAAPAGDNETAQRASAQAAANDFFAANIPATYLLSKPKLLETNVAFDGRGTVTVDVRAEAPMPVSIMQVLGFTALKPVAYAQTIRRDLDMAFVIDTSGSMKSSAAALRTSAKSFLNKFNVVQDRVGLLSFGYGAEAETPIRDSARGFDRAAMFGKINQLVFDPSTNSAEGMWQARNELQRIPSEKRSSMRVIVFFSDGVPTALASFLPFKGNACKKSGAFDYSSNGLYPFDRSDGVQMSGTCRLNDPYKSGDHMGTYVTQLPEWYNAHNAENNPNDPTKREFRIVNSGPGLNLNPWRSVTSDLSSATAVRRNVDGASRNLVEAIAAKAQDEDIYVFTLGLGADLRAKSTMWGNETGEDILKCLANVPEGPKRCYRPEKKVGMYCYAATDADLTPCFSRLASAILRISK